MLHHRNLPLRLHVGDEIDATQEIPLELIFVVELIFAGKSGKNGFSRIVLSIKHTILFRKLTL